jgi:hypothetical protein
MDDTLLLWEDFKRGKYDVFIGEIGIEEIGRCREPRKSILESYLAAINFTLVGLNADIRHLANKIIEQGILTRKSFDDCLHIASAVIADCDLITSWNFKHMVNHKTIDGVKIVSALTKYRDVAIYTPTMLIGGDDDDS